MKPESRSGGLVEGHESGDVEATPKTLEEVDMLLQEYKEKVEIGSLKEGKAVLELGQEALKRWVEAKKSRDPQDRLFIWHLLMQAEEIFPTLQTTELMGEQQLLAGVVGDSPKLNKAYGEWLKKHGHEFDEKKYPQNPKPGRISEIFNREKNPRNYDSIWDPEDLT